MKKYILPVICLALLTGCGKVVDSTDDKPINIVSGTVEAGKKGNHTSESETYLDNEDGSQTTTKSAGKKVSGTTTVNAKKSTIRTVTRADSGVVHGTTRVVPVAPRNNTNHTNSNNNTNNTPAQQQESTQEQNQTPSFDKKDYSSVTLNFDSKNPDKISVSRKYSDDNVRQYQTLSIDTSYIQEQLENDSSKKFEDFIVKKDFDDDQFPDLCIYEKEEGLNKVCKYYRYDPETGAYMPWDDLNDLKYEVSVNSNTDRIEVCEKKDDKIEYETKTFEWNAQKKLIMRESIHQYTNAEGKVLIEYVEYDENGNELLRRTEDSQGRDVSDPETDSSNEE